MNQYPQTATPFEVLRDWLNESVSAQLLFLLLGVALLLGFATSCTTSAATKPPAPPQVSVADVECKQIGEKDDFNGRLEAVKNVEVRPRVSGYLQSVNFKEGAIVRQGDLLFQIDARPFKAEVDRLRGDVAEAKAQLARAQNDFQRAERLHNNNGMSVEEYDRRASARNEAEARIASMEGALRGAELNLEFTRVTAPITGRVGRAEITEGNLVGSGPAQLKPLTTVVSLAPIYVYFDADEQNYLKYERLAFAGKDGMRRQFKAGVSLGLADEDGYPHAGTMDFIDNQVSSTTGTIRVRASFPNKDLALTPGLFARVRLQGSNTYPACLAKDEAIGTDLNQKFVLAVTKTGTLEYRPVKTGPIVEGLRVVSSGLQGGDAIVVNGLQRVRPGMAVTPVKVAMRGNMDSSKVATNDRARAPGAPDPQQQH
jgi:multidrug efflux system membrane fusion protein